jgi:nicotinate-nucleotide adenylyltransferase
MKKVGIMGGSFNPIHYGHLLLAECAYEQLGLQRILFMPLREPPHKNSAELASGDHRANMVKLAIKDNPHFKISMLELSRNGTTYTADSLSILKEENPKTEYYFIVGADSFFALQNWRDPQRIFDLCTVVVAGRDLVPKNKMKQQLDFLQESYDARVAFIDMPAVGISSAMIRSRIAANKSIKYFVPGEVEDYIRELHLYEEVKGAKPDET